MADSAPAQPLSLPSPAPAPAAADAAAADALSAGAPATAAASADAAPSNIPSELQGVFGAAGDMMRQIRLHLIAAYATRMLCNAASPAAKALDIFAVFSGAS